MFALVRKNKRVAMCPRLNSSLVRFGNIPLSRSPYSHHRLKIPPSSKSSLFSFSRSPLLIHITHLLSIVPLPKATRKWMQIFAITYSRMNAFVSFSQKHICITQCPLFASIFCWPCEMLGVHVVRISLSILFYIYFSIFCLLYGSMFQVPFENSLENFQFKYV